MIQEYIHPLVAYLHTHPHWGWFIAYLAAFVESLAIIGTVIPGSVTMTAIGALIGSNVLPAFSTILAAVIGSYTGDCLSYWLGVHYHEHIRGMWPFYKFKNWISKGETFFKLHGGKSVLIGRFAGPVRSVVPMIAGILRMPPLRFFPIAFIAALLWAIIYMLPGILLGALSLELPPKLATKFILLCLFIIALIWGLTWLTKYFFDQLWHQIDRSLIKWWNYLNTHKNSHWFTELLRNPEHEEDHQQLVRAVFFILSSLLFLWVLINVATNGPLTHLNNPLYHLLQSTRTHITDNFMVAMTLLGDKHVLLIMSTIVSLYLIWRRRWWTTFHWIALTFLSVGAIDFFKRLIYSPRPPIAIVNDTTSSFPSGHTLLSLTLFGFLSVIVADNIPVERRKYAYYLVAILVVAIGFSRIDLGAHWLTDSLASIFLGLALLLFVAISYRRRTLRPITATTLALVAGVSLFITWIGYSYYHFTPLRQQFTPTWPIQTTSLQNWWHSSAMTQFPLYRINRLGNPIQPLNIQWLGSLDEIKQSLMRRGWESHPPKIDLNATINRFTSPKTQANLPILPMLYHQRAPLLLLTKNLGNDQPLAMLRLWQSDIIVNSGAIPLWLGTINYYEPPVKLISLKKQPREFEDAIDALTPALKDFRWKLVQIPAQNQPPQMQPLNWDGKLLLIRKK